METILVVPGLHNSSQAHWQTWFESVVPGTRRIEQPDWVVPYLPGWANQVSAGLAVADQPVWIVAHSFGCLATVAAAVRFPEKVRGVLLVAPADPDRFRLPHVLLEESLPFPAVVVASENDPWVSLASARYWAGVWGADFINAGRLGHINVDSGYGPWPQVLNYFEQLQQRAASESLQAA